LQVDLKNENQEKEQTQSPALGDETDALPKEKSCDELLDFEKVIDEEYGIKAGEQPSAEEATKEKEGDAAAKDLSHENDDIEGVAKANILEDVAQKDVFISDIDEKGSDAVGRRLSQSSDKIAASPEKMLAESSGMQADTKSSGPVSPAPSFEKESSDAKAQSRTSTPQVPASPTLEKATPTDISKSPAPETDGFDEKSRSASPQRTESPLKELEDSLQEEIPLEASPSVATKIPEDVNSHQANEAPSPIPSPGLSVKNDTFAVDSVLTKSPSPEPELKEIEALKGESPSPAPSISEAIAVQSGIALSPIPQDDKSRIDTGKAAPIVDIEHERSESQNKEHVKAKQERTSPQANSAGGSPAPKSPATVDAGLENSQSPAPTLNEAKESSKSTTHVSSSKIEETTTSHAKSTADSPSGTPSPVAKIASPVPSPEKETGSLVPSPEVAKTGSPSASPVATPAKVEASSPVPSPEKMKTGSPSISPVASQEKSKAGTPTMSPAPSPDIEKTGSTAPLPEIGESGSPVPPTEKAEKISPDPSQVNSKSPVLSTVPSPAKLEAGSPVPMEDKSTTNSPALSPAPSQEKSKTGSPALSPAPSQEKSKTGSPALSPAPSQEKSKTGSPALSPVPCQENSKTGSPALSPVPLQEKSKTGSPALSPVPSQEKSKTGSPALSPVPSTEKSKTGSPALSPVPSTEKAETISPVPSQENARTGTPSSSPVPEIAKETAKTSSPTPVLLEEEKGTVDESKKASVEELTTPSNSGNQDTSPIRGNKSPSINSETDLAGNAANSKSPTPSQAQENLEAVTDLSKQEESAKLSKSPSPAPAEKERADSAASVTSQDKMTLSKDVESDILINTSPSPSIALEDVLSGSNVASSPTPNDKLKGITGIEVDIEVPIEDVKSKSPSPIQSTSPAAVGTGDKRVESSTPSPAPSPALNGELLVHDSKIELPQKLGDTDLKDIVTEKTLSPTPSQSSIREKTTLNMEEKEMSASISPSPAPSPAPADLICEDDKMDIPSHPSVLEEIATTLGLEKAELNSSTPSPIPADGTKSLEESRELCIGSASPTQTSAQHSGNIEETKSPSNTPSPGLLEHSLENEDKRGQNTPSPADSQVSVHEENSLKDSKAETKSPAPTPSAVGEKKDRESPSPAPSQGSIHDGEQKEAVKSPSPTQSTILPEDSSANTEKLKPGANPPELSQGLEKEKSKSSSPTLSSAINEESPQNIEEKGQVATSPTPSQTSVSDENLIKSGKEDISKSPSPNPALTEDSTAQKDVRDNATPSPALSQGSVHDGSTLKNDNKDTSKSPSPAPSPVVPDGTSEEKKENYTVQEETLMKVNIDKSKLIESTSSPEPRKSETKESATVSQSSSPEPKNIDIKESAAASQSSSPTPTQTEDDHHARSPIMTSPALSDISSRKDGEVGEMKVASPAPSQTEGEVIEAVKSPSPSPSVTSDKLEAKVSKPPTPVSSPMLMTASEEALSKSPSPNAQLAELMPLKGDQSPVPSTSPLPTLTESGKQEENAGSKSLTPSASPVPDRTNINDEKETASQLEKVIAPTEAVDEVCADINGAAKSSSPVQTTDNAQISKSSSPASQTELPKMEAEKSAAGENIKSSSATQVSDDKEDAERPQSASSVTSQVEVTATKSLVQSIASIITVSDKLVSEVSEKMSITSISPDSKLDADKSVETELKSKTPSPLPMTTSVQEGENIHVSKSPSPTTMQLGEQTADVLKSKSPSPTPSFVTENNVTISQSPPLISTESRRESMGSKQETILKSDILTKVTSDLQLKEGILSDSPLAESMSSSLSKSSVEVKTEISPDSSVQSGVDRKSPEKLFTSSEPAPSQATEKTPSPSEVSDPITASYIEIINKLQSDSSDVASHTKLAQIDDPMTRSTLFGDSIETSVVPDTESVVQTTSVIQDAYNIVDELITKSSHHRLMLTASSEDGGEETEFDTVPQPSKEKDDKIVIEAKIHEKMTVKKYQCEGGDDSTLPSSCAEKKITSVTSTGVTADKFSLPEDAKMLSRIEKQIELDHSSIFVAANSAVATKMGELDDVISSTCHYYTGKTDQLDRATTPEIDSVPASPHSDISSGQMSRDPHVWDDNRSSSRQSEISEKDIASPPFTTSKLKFEVTPQSVMTGSFYGGLPGDEDVHPVVETVAKDVKDSKNQIAKMGEIAAATIGAMAASLPFGGPSTSSNAAKEDDKSATAAVAPTKEKDPIESWGKPLGLPSPAPPATTNEAISQNGTPKKERRVVATKKGSDRQKSKSNKDSAVKNKIPSSPMYFDLTYVPHHGNSNYSQVEFFKNVRARYYVFSGIEPSREVYDALLEGKQSWDEKDLGKKFTLKTASDQTS
jgi:hypothetical protein